MVNEPSKVIDPSLPVLVTGASGYIGSWIVRTLLEAGYTVRGTVRNPQKAKGLEHLHKLSEDHPGRLSLFKADLLEKGSFDEAMDGCELVIHTASPFLLTGFTDAEEALVRPALEGTRNVLDSVNRTKSVKRVVLTSSVVAIYGDNCESLGVPGGVFTDEHWNTTSSVDHQPYSYSKTVAEQEAWRYQKAQDRWDMVTVHPGMVFGPALTKASDSASLSTMKQFTDGTLLAAADSNNTVKIWNVASGVQVGSITHSGVRSVTFSPNGEVLVSGGVAEITKVWKNDGASWVQLGGDLKPAPASSAASTHIDTLAFSPDGTKLAVGEGTGDERMSIFNFSCTGP